ncbi:MAG: DUF3090 family protein [Candidatus Planktophila sp.]|jgi:uncharacterized repeat protein (TIGR03847 family)|tara:strand:+ start:1466 stop:2014 length:549 start_codon:yes stop_codon:yes gene_type:complete
MAGQIFLFDPVERFVVGTVGLPGERTFFLQARTGARLISVALEKSQVLALSERIQQILREVRISEPLTIVEKISLDELPLESPIDEEFRVGAIGLAYLSERKIVELDFRAIGTPEFEQEELLGFDSQGDEDILRVLLSLGYAESFAKRADKMIAAGRRPCPFCGGPIDPAGHICPRANGYRR